MPHLFEPYSIKDVTLRNRVGISPMCQYSAEDGLANDWHLVHLGSRAVGGAGLILCEATAVEARGRITPNDLGIWSDEQVEPLARLARVIEVNGAVPGIQIAHAGRKANTHRPWEGGGPIPPDNKDAWEVIAPSSRPYKTGYQEPAPMSRAEIQSVQGAFRQAAARVQAASFLWLEIHAAHGYLIHNFCSPLSNQREDAYGGSFDNRIRFLVETVQAIRQVWPERLPLTVRLSCTDWMPGGWTIEESVALARWLKVEGVDLIDCSSGGNQPGAPVPVGPGYQVPLAETIRREAQIPVAAVGLITAPAQADEIIRNGRADVVLLGREALRDPYWPLHAAKELKQPFPIPSQYLRAF